jgi:hypothetical protein
VIRGVAINADGAGRSRPGVLQVLGGGVVLEGLVMRNVIRLVDRRDRGSGAGLQPVVPLAFLTVRSKPPSKKPQLIPGC